MKVEKKGSRVNEFITAKQVKLVDEGGCMLGVVDTVDAMSKAKDAGLDLVEVFSEGDFPVCKIFDYSKHRYNNKKKACESKKRQRVVSVKELKFRLNIEDNDYNIKLNSLKSFIEKGNKVKVSIRFVGRELQYKEVGVGILERLAADTESIARPDSQPRMDGNVLSVVFSGKH